MTVIRRMAAGYAGFLVLLVALGGVVTAMWLWFEGQYVDTTQGTNEQIIAASKIVESAAPMAARTQAAVLAQDEGLRSVVEAQLEADYEATKQAIAAVAAMEAGDEDQEDLGALEDLALMIEDYHDVIAGVISEATTDQTMALTVLTGRVLPAGEEFEEAVRAYANDQIEEAATTLSSVRSTGHVALLVNLVVLAAAVALGVVFVVLIIRSISRRLRAATTGLSSSTAELMAVSSQVASGAAQTAASTSETTATVEEVKQTAMLAQEKASAAAEGATGAVENIGSARELSEDTAAGIQRVQGQMDVVFEAINTLSERAQAAGDIVASVNDLAEQSNLLSVNASIEAAKAGEYGKGFTVVAQEVKSLAEQSKQAVEQVRSMLGEIQKASQTAVEAATQSREAVEAGRQKSMEAGEVMQRVADGARDDAESSLQAVASARQQMAGMEQIAKAIESIDRASGQAADGTRQVDREIKHLQELALKLRSLADRSVIDHAGHAGP